jgi:putative hydrolase of the HAD superfamily
VKPFFDRKNMKKINTIIFDYGYVISQNQDQDAIQKMCSNLDISLDQFKATYYSTRVNYDAGLISGLEFWNTISLKNNKGKLSERKISELILQDNLSWSKFNLKIINFIEELKNSGIKLAILSNIPSDTVKYLNENTDILNFFKYRIFSCEEKLMKPDKRIFEAALKKLKEPPENVLFIDDLENNIKGASDTGINVIHFRDYDQMKNLINKNYYWD